MRPRAWWLVLLVPLLVPGCYGKQLFRGPITTDENAQEIAKIREELAAAEERLVRLEELSEEQIEMLRSIRAEFAAGNDETIARIEALEARLGESSDQIERVEGKLDRVQYRIGRRPAAATAEGEEADSGAVVIDPKPLFDAAYLDLVRGNYRAAMAGFGAYLEAYPRSALSDDARYWIGECHFAEGELEEAAEQFRRVERDHPDSERVPAALLKLANCHVEMGETGEARKILTRIVDEHPASVEAPLAKEKLREID